MLVWGAINARPPSRSTRQVDFDVDYSGGWGSLRDAGLEDASQRVRRVPRPATPVPRHGVHGTRRLALGAPAAGSARRRTSAFRRGSPAMAPRSSGSRTGAATAEIEVWLDWSYGGRWHHLFGRLTLPRPADPRLLGDASTATRPTASAGSSTSTRSTPPTARAGAARTGSSRGGPDGTFCYGFVPHRTSKGTRGPANGRRYRLATSGPGVTPDVSWEGTGLHDFRPGNPADEQHEAAMNALQRQMMKQSKGCHD